MNENIIDYKYEMVYVTTLKGYKKAIKDNYVLIYTPKEFDKEVFAYLESNKDDNKRLLFQYGYALLLGKGVEKDTEKAIEIISKIAKKGDLEAMTNYGLYEISEGNKGIGLKFVKKAARKGYAIAEKALGNIYVEGELVDKDYRKAFKLFKSAADKGLAKAQNSVGNMYKVGVGTRRDMKKSVEYYRLAAEQGNVAAQYNLGNMFFGGYGVKQNYELAAFYYSLAAEANDKDALFNMGYMYEQGFGIKKSYRKAFALYKKASERGNLVASYNLGVLYFKGRGTKKNNEEGFKMHLFAAKKGLIKAQCSVVRLYIKGIGTDVNVKEALKWSEIVLRSEDVEAKTFMNFFLGYLYERGIGVDKDLKKAEKHYKYAAGYGEVEAQINLAKLLEKEKRIDEAELWYTLAIRDKSERTIKLLKTFLKKHKRIRGEQNE